MVGCVLWFVENVVMWVLIIKGCVVLLIVLGLVGVVCVVVLCFEVIGELGVVCDNVVLVFVLDVCGLLWVGLFEGLLCFDGYVFWCYLFSGFDGKLLFE